MKWSVQEWPALTVATVRGRNSQKLLADELQSKFYQSKQQFSIGYL